MVKGRVCFNQMPDASAIVSPASVSPAWL